MSHWQLNPKLSYSSRITGIQTFDILTLETLWALFPSCSHLFTKLNMTYSSLLKCGYLFASIHPRQWNDSKWLHSLPAWQVSMSCWYFNICQNFTNFQTILAPSKNWILCSSCSPMTYYFVYIHSSLSWHLLPPIVTFKTYLNFIHAIIEDINIIKSTLSATTIWDMAFDFTVYESNIYIS